MTHVRKGKEAKRNRRYSALERLRDWRLAHEWYQRNLPNYGDSDRKRYEQIKAEIKTLESRI